MRGGGKGRRRGLSKHLYTSITPFHHSTGLPPQCRQAPWCSEPSGSSPVPLLPSSLRPHPLGCPSPLTCHTDVASSHQTVSMCFTKSVKYS